MHCTVSQTVERFRVWTSSGTLKCNDCLLTKRYKVDNDKKQM